MMTNAQVFQIKNIFKTMLGVFTNFYGFFLYNWFKPEFKVVSPYVQILLYLYGAIVECLQCLFPNALVDFWRNYTKNCVRKKSWSVLSVFNFKQ